MTPRGSIALRAGVLAVMAGVSLGASTGTPKMGSQPMRLGAPLLAQPSARSPEATEVLFLGDMSPESSFGCGPPNAPIGPHEWATRVTSGLTPPFGIVSTTYAIGPGSATTTWDLVAWNGGATPGSEIQRCDLGPAHGTAGVHTVAVPPGCLTIPQAAGSTFFFGFSQGPDLAGVFFGEDTDGATPNTVFVRNSNASCGMPNFVPVEALGFPGYLVHSITVDDAVPVELMSFSVR